jgi:dihydrofolate synthase/folylpolyglutamate synthase
MKLIEEVEKYLYSLRSHKANTDQKDMSLNSMWPLLERVGNPHMSLTVVHVAGTSGKTSTCVYIANLLKQAGFHTGLTISPHIESITERLQIDGAPVSNEEFCKLFSQFISLFENQPLKVTYFEFMIVFILWSFVQRGVEVAIIETGLGGLYDGTNVCRLPNKICVITDIGLDHQEILGNTIEKIATQKAGIIHKSNSVFMYQKAPAVQQIFSGIVKKKDAKLFIVDEKPYDQSNRLTRYQQRNWHLAHQVAKFFCEREGVTLPRSDVLGITQSDIPGRMQKVQKNGTLFIIDGAHNEQKAKAFIESLEDSIGKKSIPVILAVKKDKDLHGLLKVLKPFVRVGICTQYRIAQDAFIASMSANEVAAAVTSLDIPVLTTSSIEDAINEALKLKEPVVLITGSLYMIGEALRVLKTTP